MSKQISHTTYDCLKLNNETHVCKSDLCGRSDLRGAKLLIDFTRLLCGQRMADESDVDLPPDVVSDSEVELPPDVMSDVDLPPDVEDDGRDMSEQPVPANQWCTCKLRCFTKFSAEHVEFHRGQQLADQNRMANAYHKIKVMVEQRSSSDTTCKIQWSIDGTRVCRPWWEHYHAIGHGQVDDMVKLSKAGHPHLPERGARMPREKQKSDIVDAWFLNLYQGSSEPIPVEGSADRLEELSADSLQHEVVNDIHHPLYGLSVAVGQGVNKQHLAPKRFLNEENLSSLWGLYQSDATVQEKVSRDTFTKAFSKRWKGLLNFKQHGQGTRCQLCADMDEERKQCTTKTERQELDLRKQHHFQRHDADRSMNVRSNQLSSDPSTYLLQHSSSKLHEADGGRNGPS